LALAGAVMVFALADKGCPRVGRTEPAFASDRKRRKDDWFSEEVGVGPRRSGNGAEFHSDGF